MKTISAGATDAGLVRHHNEDALLVDDEAGLYIVADGMGGPGAGEVAAAMAIAQVRRELKGLGGLLKDVVAGNENARRRLLRTLPRIMDHASDAIYRRSHEDSATAGMGTTCLFVLLAGHEAFVCHLGDGRLYLLRGQHFEQLTEDHTYVAELLKSGQISKEEAAVHPQRNVLQRALGATPGVHSEVLALDLRPGDHFLLCSDGLTDLVRDAEIQQLMSRYDGDNLVGGLIQRAHQAGGHDNIAVVALEVVGQPEDQEVGTGIFDVIDKVELLHDVFLFQDLSNHELLTANRCLMERHYDDGDVVVAEGDPGDALFVVASGRVAVQKKGVTLVEIPPGGHFGDLSLLLEEPRTATVIACGATTCFSISREDLLELAMDDTSLGTKLLWAFARNLGNRVKTLSSELAVLRASS